MSAAKAKCEIDGHESHYLADHLAEEHQLTVAEYLEQYPDAVVESDSLRETFDEAMKNARRAHPPTPEELVVSLHGMSFKVNPDVPESACLPLPDHYRLPQFGNNAAACKRALRHLHQGRSTWVHGGPGGGKDALPSAVSWWTRTPAEIFPINPNTDIQPWFFSKAFNKDGAYWEFGRLFQCLTEGYVSPVTGRQVPMLIVLSDFDRANRSQAEPLRLIADSIQGRIKGPHGETYAIVPGTQIYITANTMGGGDPTGRAVSANVIDSTIINRIERKLHMPMLDWRDEKPIIEAKFPLFVETCGHLLNAVGLAVAALRQAVEHGTIYAEFSHRDVCTWIGECEDIIRTSGKVPPDLLKQGFMSYADGLPDEHTKQAALSACDAHFKGGMLDRGKVSGVRDEDLPL